MKMLDFDYPVCPHLLKVGELLSEVGEHFLKCSQIPLGLV